MENKGQIVLSNFIWRFFERCGAQLVAFIVSVVLARLLEPGVYGTIALVTVFTTILQVFIDSGFGNALIQKKNTDDLDFSTVFYFNIIVCCIIYFIMFLIAPYIADFYRNEELIPIIRVLSFTLIIAGVKNIQQAYVSKTMQFKKFFFSTLGGTIVAAFVGISMAYCGYGVWALVAQQIVNASIDTIVLWVTVKWRPKLIFSLNRLKLLFAYGWKLLISSLIDRTYTELRSLVIGKYYSSTDLAYYNRGNQLPNIFVTNINNSIDSVLFPAMSSVQDNASVLKGMVRRSIKISTYIIAPIMMGLLFAAEPIIRLLLTEKWIGCVPYLRIFCFSFMFYPIHTANLNAIKALGRSDIFLKLEIAKKTVGVISLLVTFRVSVMAMAYSLLVTSVLDQVINCWPNKKLLGYGYMEQLKDIIPNILLSLVMGGCVYCVQFIGLSDIFTLSIQIILGISVYIIMSVALKLDTFEYLVSIVKQVMSKSKGV